MKSAVLHRWNKEEKNIVLVCQASALKVVKVNVKQHNIWDESYFIFLILKILSKDVMSNSLCGYSLTNLIIFKAPCIEEKKIKNKYL